MDKKSPPQMDPCLAGRQEPRAEKILVVIFFLLIIGSVAFTYYRIMLKKDYLISSQVDCDPYTEKCFIWNCNPNSIVEGEACTGDPEADVWYYKIAKRNASRIPLCDPEADENCQPFLCDPGEPECEEILCNAETAAGEEACNDPEEYALNNPIEEVACDPEIDAECEGVDCDPEVDGECSVEETETLEDTGAEAIE